MTKTTAMQVCHHIEETGLIHNPKYHYGKDVLTMRRT